MIQLERSCLQHSIDLCSGFKLSVRCFWFQVEEGFGADRVGKFLCYRLLFVRAESEIDGMFS